MAHIYNGILLSHKKEMKLGRVGGRETQEGKDMGIYVYVYV